MNTTRPEGLRPVVLTDYSQPHMLNLRMREANLTHGETVTANLSSVRIEPDIIGRMVMYFCPLSGIDIVEHITPGDGGCIPAYAKAIDLSIPADLKPGLYELQNVKLFSNGTMQVISTEETKFKVLCEDPTVSTEISTRVERAIMDRRRREMEEMAMMVAESRRVLANTNWPF